MVAHKDLDKRTRIEVKILQRAVEDSPGRRFQGYLEPKEVLSASRAAANRSPQRSSRAGELTEGATTSAPRERSA